MRGPPPPSASPNGLFLTVFQMFHCNSESSPQNNSRLVRSVIFHGIYMCAGVVLGGCLAKESLQGTRLLCHFKN